MFSSHPQTLSRNTNSSISDRGLRTIWCYFLLIVEGECAGVVGSLYSTAGREGFPFHGDFRTQGESQDYAGRKPVSHPRPSQAAGISDAAQDKSVFRHHATYLIDLDATSPSVGVRFYTLLFDTNRYECVCAELL